MCRLTTIHVTCAFAVTALVWLTLPLAAQQPSPQDIQRMMQHGADMAACMANIDQAALQDLQSHSAAMQQEIAALCRNGQRDQAQQRAIELARTIADAPAMRAMAQCGEMAQSFMPAMPFADAVSQSMHVCEATQ